MSCLSPRRDPKKRKVLAFIPSQSKCAKAWHQWLLLSLSVQSHSPFSCTPSWLYQMYSSMSANILAQSKGIQQRFFTESSLVSHELWKQKRLLSSAWWVTRVVPVKGKKREHQVYIRRGWDWQLPDTTQWGSSLSTVSRMFTTRDSEKLSERVVISGSDTFYSPWGPFPYLPCDLSTCYCPLVLSTYWWHWPWKAHGLICKWYYCVWKDNSILGQRLEVDMWMWRLNKLETISKCQFAQAKVSEGFTKQCLRPGTAVAAR